MFRREKYFLKLFLEISGKNKKRSDFFGRPTLEKNVCARSFLKKLEIWPKSGEKLSITNENKIGNFTFFGDFAHNGLEVVHNG